MPATHTIAMLGRYPLLVDYLSDLLTHSIQGSAIKRYDSTPKPDNFHAADRVDLWLLLHDRDTHLQRELQTLTTIAVMASVPILILSEQATTLGIALPQHCYLRDLSITAPHLCSLIQQLLRHEEVTAYRSELTSSYRLTSKERQVLQHLSNGISNKMIAERMQLAEPTVKFHMRKLFAKTGFDSRIQMALSAPQVLAMEESGYQRTGRVQKSTDRARS